jgi:fermentation-respiration switch protein FrsA (DUF1100 family)
MSLLLKIGVVAAALYVALALGARFLERRLMYFPDTARFNPARAGLAGVEEVVLGTPDGERVIIWSGAAQRGQPTILYFHGNGGSLESRSERIRKYMARGFGMFMMSYRGFSGSSGSPSEAANVGDAKLAYDTLVARGVDPADIIVYGESLGSGVAVQVAAEKRVAGVILDAPYTSMVDLASLHYPQLPRWLMRDRYETTQFIGTVTAPLLIVHGEEDDVVPVTRGRALFEAANAPKEIATLPGAGHGDHYLFGSYDKIFAWIDRLRDGRLTRAAE